MATNQTTTEIRDFHYKNQEFKFEMGKKYNLRNGYALFKDDLWLLDTEFMGYEFYGDEPLLKFKHNEVVFFIDMDFMYKFHHSIKMKCWQYLPK